MLVSVRETEALERLRLLESFLRALGEPFDRRGDTIDLLRMPRSIRVLACNIGSVSGPRAFGRGGDEAAKWRTTEGALNATEVWSSVRAMCVTHRAARGAFISSAFSTVDYHYERIEQGTSDRQLVVTGPTWEWNDITEQQTRALEPDERIWKREYLGVPQGAVSQAFETDDVLGSFRPLPTTHRPWGWTLIIDPSSGGADAWAYCCASWHYAPPVSEFLTYERYWGRGLYTTEYKYDNAGERIPNPEFEKAHAAPILRIEGIGQSASLRKLGISGADVVAELVAKVCRPRRIVNVAGDQHLAFMLEPEFKRHGVFYRSFPWTNSNKQAAVERVRQWMADGTLCIAESERESENLRRQLLQYDEKITRSGAITYAGRGSTHDDLAALLITAALADDENQLSVSPYAPRVRRYVGIAHG